MNALNSAKDADYATDEQNRCMLEVQDRSLLREINRLVSRFVPRIAPVRATEKEPVYNLRGKSGLFAVAA